MRKRQEADGKTSKLKYAGQGVYYKTRSGTTPGGRKYTAFKELDGTSTRTRVTVQGRGAGGPSFEKRKHHRDAFVVSGPDAGKKVRIGSMNKTSQKWGENPKTVKKGPTKPVGKGRK